MRPVRGDWSIPGALSAQPLLLGDTVFAAFTDGLVVAADRRDGRIIWQRKLLGPVYGRRLLSTATVLVVPEIELHGLDRRTGALVWTHAGPAGHAGVSAPALSGDTLFVSDRGGQAAAIDANTGAVHWTTELGEVLFSPTLASDLVLFSGRGLTETGVLREGHLVALDRATGAERWRRLLPDDPDTPVSGGATSSGVVIGDRVIVGSISSDVYGLDLASGNIEWSVRSGEPLADAFRYVPVHFDGSAVLLTARGRLEARDASDGSVRWAAELTGGGVVLNQPVRCGESLCIGSGRLWLIEPGGIVRWAYGGGSQEIFLSSPAVSSDGRVFVGVDGGGGPPRLWSFMPPVSIGATP